MVGRGNRKPETGNGRPEGREQRAESPGNRGLLVFFADIATDNCIFVDKAFATGDIPGQMISKINMKVFQEQVCLIMK